jgi:hypothetical protein
MCRSQTLEKGFVRSGYGFLRRNRKGSFYKKAEKVGKITNNRKEKRDD